MACSLDLSAGGGRPSCRDRFSGSAEPSLTPRRIDHRGHVVALARRVKDPIALGVDVTLQRASAWRRWRRWTWGPCRGAPEIRGVECSGPKSALRRPSLDLGCGVSPAAELSILDRPARPNHRFSQVPAIDAALRDRPTVGVPVLQPTIDKAATDQGDEPIACDVPASKALACSVLADLPPFRCIDAPKAHPLRPNGKGVAVDDVRRRRSRGEAKSEQGQEETQGHSRPSKLIRSRCEGQP